MKAVTSNNKECIYQQLNRKDGSDNDDDSRLTSSTCSSTTNSIICSLPEDSELDEHLLHVSRLISGYYDDDDDQQNNNFDEEYDDENDDIAEIMDDDDDESDECSSHCDDVEMVDRVPCVIEFSTTSSLSMSVSTTSSRSKYPEEYAADTTKRTINDEDNHQLDSNKINGKEPGKTQLLLWAFESIDYYDSKKSCGYCSRCGIATNISSRSSSIICFEGEETNRLHREEKKQRLAHEQNGKKCFICSMYSELLE